MDVDSRLGAARRETWSNVLLKGISRLPVSRFVVDDPSGLVALGGAAYGVTRYVPASVTKPTDRTAILVYISTSTDFAMRDMILFRGHQAYDGRVMLRHGSREPRSRAIKMMMATGLTRRFCQSFQCDMDQ